MDIRHLRYFVAVAELGNVSRAAERLHVSQPPLSHQLRQLEEELGVELFVRTHRGMTLTRAGDVLLPEARDILFKADSLKRTLKLSGSDMVGFIRIGFVSSAVDLILPKLIPVLRANYPGIELFVKEMSATAQVQAIKSAQIDVGIARLPIASSQISVATEIDDQLCLAIPADHPLAISGPINLIDAKSESFVSFDRRDAPAYFDRVTSLCSDAGFSANIQYQAGTIYSMLAMVSSGLGVSIVPSTSILLRSHGIRYRRIQSTKTSGPLALIHLNNDQNPMIKVLSFFVAPIFSNLLATATELLDS